MARRGSNRNRTPLGGGASAEVAVGVIPIPSLIDGRRYQILDSGGVGRPAWVNRSGDSSGTMQVPLGVDEGERRTRLHEMAHVRWTPAHPSLPEGVSWETMNAVEDRRIHRRLKETGYQDSLDAPIMDDEGWETFDRQLGIHADLDDSRTPFPDLEVARMIVASDGTAEGVPFRELVAEYGRGWIGPVVDEIMDRHNLRGRRPAWKRTLEVAAEIDALFSELDRLPSEMRRLLPEYSRSGAGSWGKMEIIDLPLPETLPRGMQERKRRATDRGAVPRNWHRLPSDGMVFSRKVRRPSGGTVLIDQSGSMSLDPSEVLELMARFPGVLIGTYAGHGDTGHLRIIARDGKRASDDHCHHPWNGNVIDGPALDWLNEQPGPRVWISDGYVTGCGDNPVDPRLLLDAAEKVRTGGVIRLDRMGDLLDGGGGPEGGV